jgi:putative ABC transport system permease protein
MIKDYFSLALKNLRRRKLRSWLTMIGIFIAVATIFILVSISLGFQGAIEEQFRMLGTDKFFIMAKGQAGQPGSGGAVSLYIQDAEAIESVGGVKAVSYFGMANGEIEFNKEKRYLTVAGMPTDPKNAKSLALIFEAMTLKTDEGKMLQAGDTTDIMLGYDFKYNKVFDKPVRAGDNILINGQEFKVKAIMSRIGNPSDDKNIYVPFSEYKELFKTGDKIEMIWVQIDAGAELSDVAAKVEKRLRSFRDVTEKTQDFSILTPEALLDSFNTILNIVLAFLLGVAAISLVVGAIGIANTMYTAVLERYKEIGVMKAVGARNSDILSIFLIESGLLGLVGGIIGVVLGAAVSKAVEYIAVYQIGTNLLKAAFPPYLIVGCLVFAFLIGAASGTFPAWQASQIKPVQALRYE